MKLTYKDYEILAHATGFEIIFAEDEYSYSCSCFDELVNIILFTENEHEDMTLGQYMDEREKLIKDIKEWTNI